MFSYKQKTAMEITITGFFKGYRYENKSYQIGKTPEAISNKARLWCSVSILIFKIMSYLLSNLYGYKSKNTLDFSICQ